MGAEYDDTAIHITGTAARRRRWTTIVLEELPDGRWLATQTGVSVEGYGETAAEAARKYCRQISEAGDG